MRSETLLGLIREMFHFVLADSGMLLLLLLLFIDDDDNNDDLSSFYKVHHRYRWRCRLRRVHGNFANANLADSISV